MTLQVGKWYGRVDAGARHVVGYARGTLAQRGATAPSLQPQHAWGSTRRTSRSSPLSPSPAVPRARPPRTPPIRRPREAHTPFRTTGLPCQVTNPRPPLGPSTSGTNLPCRPGPSTSGTKHQLVRAPPAPMYRLREALPQCRPPPRSPSQAAVRRSTLSRPSTAH